MDVSDSEEVSEETHDANDASNNVDECCNDDVDLDLESTNNGFVMPVRKRKGAAPVWKKCALRLDDKIGKCNFCGKVFKCAVGSTSTIVSHIILKHGNLEAVKELLELIKSKRQNTLQAKELKNKKSSSVCQSSMLNFAVKIGAINPVKKR